MASKLIVNSEQGQMGGSIVDVPGLLVGHFTLSERLTGCSVVLAPAGAVGAVDVRGAAPGTRETDLLDPANLVDKVHAVLLSGGSAFGLDAASGVVRWLAEQVPGAAISFDLGDSRGYAYYSGMRFAIYAKGASDALARGGRYDGVGAVFGHRIERDRPAVGFSLDLKELVSAVTPLALRAAIRAPWGHSVALRSAIASLRSRGETVVCVLPGHESEVDEFHCDRELVEAAGQWLVQAL